MSFSHVLKGTEKGNDQTPQKSSKNKPWDFEVRVLTAATLLRTQNRDRDSAPSFGLF